MISKELVFYKLENDSNVSISNKDIIIKEDLDNTRLKMQILAKLEDELKKIDTNCYLPTIKKCISGFNSPITSKHRKTFSTQITQSTSMNTTKNKDIKKINFFHISKQKPLKVLLAPNTKIFLSDFSEFKLNKNDFFFS